MHKNFHKVWTPFAIFKAFNTKLEKQVTVQVSFFKRTPKPSCSWNPGEQMYDEQGQSKGWEGS
jgi:hypothetical protein